MTKTPTASCSIWLETATPPKESSLTTDLHCEICIIGAGITGLSTAYELLQAGKNVIIVDDHDIAQDETGHTSAHLSNALDDRYFNIAKMHGEDRAELAAASHTEAINRIEDICKKENITCDFARIPGYLFSHTSNLDEIEKEHAAARQAGIKVTYTNDTLRGKSLTFPDQARFHPIKYVQGLIAVIQKLGGKIYNQTQVNKIDFDNLELTLATGKKIKAQKIVCATNSPFMPKITMHMKLDPQRSYVVCLKIPKGSIEDALYWDTADPYHYIRLISIDEKYDGLIVGGEDHRVGFQPKGDPFNNLINWVKTKFPIDKIEVMTQWSGQILEPVDFLAYIGKHPKSPHVYMATGDSGNGLTHGVVASKIISDDILNKENRYSSLYEMNRLPSRAIISLLGNVLASSVAYLKYLLPQWGKMPKQGEGKILQHGVKKIAVYKDENNKLYKCSGTCPHLGAVLSWNPIEKTWDCSAHGSRFDIHGKRLNGPATTNLTCPFKK